MHLLILATPEQPQDSCWLRLDAGTGYDPATPGAEMAIEAKKASGTEVARGQRDDLDS
jgi:hypothetical protein